MTEASPTLHQATALAKTLPALLVEARQLSQTVMQGLHGRKRAGTGENFWQYRAYHFGDPVNRIDWRRSARSNQVYVRENEWESVNRLWLWVSPTEEMDFQSHLAQTTKRERANLISLAIATLALDAHEHVGLLNSPQPASHSRKTLFEMGEKLLAPQASPLHHRHLRRSATVVLFSDFYQPLAELEAEIAQLAATGCKGVLVQIADPAEVTLPYKGRIEFQSMNLAEKFLASHAQSLSDAYHAVFLSQRKNLQHIASRWGWTMLTHETNQSPAVLLMALYQHVGKIK